MSVSVDDLTRSQKAAAVLLSVGSDAAAKVLEHMSETEVEQVALEIATLGKIPPAQLEAILEEFRTEVDAHGRIISGGEEHARTMLRRVRGADADDIVDRVLVSVRRSPFQFLRLHEASEVVQHLRDEHPQTVALILAHLPTRFAAEVLAGLDPDVQADVAFRVANLDRISPELVSRVEAALEERFGSHHGQRDQERGGVAELAAVLNHSDRSTERAILGALDRTDPELAEEVRALMFVFEDITTLDDRALQEVLRQVEAKELALAMKGVSDEVRDAVERNLSERARVSLHEEIEILGPARVRDVEAAQGEIVRLIRRMEEAGEIIVSRGNDGEFVE